MGASCSGGWGARRGGVLAAAASVVISAAVSALALGQPPDAIRWSAERPLTWDDFRGPVDPQVDARLAAQTSASLQLRYGIEFLRNGGCVFSITDAEAEAWFLPSESWARERARIPLVLEHEQGHFDLTEVYRVMLQREVDALVGEERECDARDRTEEIEAQAARIVDRVRERIWEQLGRMQARYDAETQHGTLADIQREWTERIRDALASRSRDPLE